MCDCFLCGPIAKIIDYAHIKWYAIIIAPQLNCWVFFFVSLFLVFESVWDADEEREFAENHFGIGFRLQCQVVIGSLLV